MKFALMQQPSHIQGLFTGLIYKVGRAPNHVDSSLLRAWYLSRAWKTYWAREDTSRLLPSGMSMVTSSPILGTSFWARLSAVEMTSMITTAPSPHLSRGVPLRPRLSVVRVLSGEEVVSENIEIVTSRRGIIATADFCEQTEIFASKWETHTSDTIRCNAYIFKKSIAYPEA